MKTRSLPSSLTARLASLAALGGLGAAASAQGGGFTAHDVYVYGRTASAGTGAITRLNPVSGASSQLTALDGIWQNQGSMAFDPYRQRLVYVGWAPGHPNPELHLADASGATATLVQGYVSWGGLSPTGDGRIYFHDQTSSTQPLKWLDAANHVHVLYDTDGVTPYALESLGSWLEDMIYHPGENALFTVHIASGAACPGGNPTSTHVRKVPLSADGTHVSGPTTCGEFDVYVGDLDYSRGFSLMSDGDLLLGAHSGVYGPPLPRLLRVDPATVVMTPFAFFGDGSNGGCGWSSALGKALVQDHFNAKLLAYADGQVDDGVPVGPALFSDTFVDLAEIPLSTCQGGWIAYGAGLAGKGAIVPTLTGQGCPKPGGAIALILDDAVGGAPGLVAAGFAPAALPFVGGTLLVAPIALQFPALASGAPGRGRRGHRRGAARAAERPRSGGGPRVPAGRVPGRRRGAIVLPDPGPADAARRVRVGRRRGPTQVRRSWVEFLGRGRNSGAPCCVAAA